MTDVYRLQTAQDDGWRRAVTRCLLSGPPNSGKTTSLRTWPGVVIQSYPGEKGVASIPYSDGVRAFVGSLPPPGEPVNYAGVIAETERLTTEILTGKHSEVTTFAGDGLHKLHELYLAEATAGASMEGREFDPRLYGSAHKRFFRYLDMVLRSPVPYIVFTVWDGHEKDDPDERGATPSRHIYPELPGLAAKRMMGEFSLVLYSTRQGTGPATKFIWQTQPFGKVWGAGAKLPIEVARRLPVTVEQDWRVVERIILGESKS